eukprot:2422648-Prymnesium_polylepis.1
MSEGAPIGIASAARAGGAPALHNFNWQIATRCTWTKNTKLMLDERALNGARSCNHSSKPGAISFTV